MNKHLGPPATTDDLPFTPPSEKSNAVRGDLSVGTLGTLVRNGGGETLLIPETELREVDAIGRELAAEDAERNSTAPESAEIRRQSADGPQTTGCEQCGEPFEPRKRSGGKPQRFCKPACRAAFHASEGQRGQRSGSHVGEKPAGPADTDKVVAAVAQAVAKYTTPRPEPEPDFDWSSDDSILIEDQPATAVYRNKRGQIVIRQEQAWDRDEDSFVFIAPNNLQELIDRLCDLGGIRSAP